MAPVGMNVLSTAGREYGACKESSCDQLQLSNNGSKREI